MLAPVLAAVLVVSNAENTATLLDATTLRPIARFATGPGPHEVTVARDQRFAYVADAGQQGKVGRTVTVLDLARREVAATWDLGEGSQPHDLRVSRDGALVWVACAPRAAVLEIDASDGSVVRSYPTGKDGGWMLAAAPDDQKLYVAHLEGGGISIIDRKSGRVTFVATGHGEMALDVSPDGREVWAANLDSGIIRVIDGQRDVVTATFPSGAKGPVRLKLTSDGKRAVIVHKEPRELTVFDVARRRPMAHVPLPHEAKILALSPDGKRAYVSEPDAGTLTSVDLEAGRAIATVPTGTTPDGVTFVGEPGPFPARFAFSLPEPDTIPEGIAHDPETGTFYVGSTYRRKIVAVARGEARDFVTEGLLGVVGMHVDPKHRLLWVASSDAGKGMPMKGGAPDGQGAALLACDLATGAIVQRFGLPGPHFLNDVAVSETGEVYVTDSQAGTVYAVRGKTLEPLAPPGTLPEANGLVVAPGPSLLYVSTSGGIVAFDPETRLATPLGIEAADGLAFHKDALIAIHPWSRGRVVTRHVLSGTRVLRSDVLVPDDPEHLQPTTGVVVGNELFYIANSQLQLFRSLIRPDGGYPGEVLRQPVILRVGL